MLKKMFFACFAIFFLHGLAQQQVHVKYYHVRSPIATLYEDLYIKDNNVISIQDSIINFNSAGTMAAVKSSSKPISKNYFISKLNTGGKTKDFFFTGLNKEVKYFVHDQVAEPAWKIDESKTKKILGYNCIQAKGIFRGSEITAYFTKELPYSAGPFKFYGLPGVILDIREENKNFNIWKAEKVELTVDPKINFTPALSDYPKITMKEFIVLKEGNQEKEMADLLSRMPPGTKVQNNSNKRPGLEKSFEWESMYRQ
ncbi:GLPGLI family protein [Chryseobacterium sp. G0240]|uniref:GLPGLI family protein n=1 Tax=Chryseobacterium sp. G0240 TaxID=2487066 RepID=UPI000F45C8E4|nr:GLPGLI family protein [Chryseobacterium sp. G0240]ROI05438.1 GLPGLI family protein [Chryseobacterium sp. G0240]